MRPGRKKSRRLAEAEWEIMEGMWALGPRRAVREVHDHLYPNGEKAYTTVQTVMNILADKGYLNREKVGGVNFFTPLVSREEVGRRETGTLVSRIYRGSFGALVTYLVDAGSFSREELKQIKAQIEAKERERRKP